MIEPWDKTRTLLYRSDVMRSTILNLIPRFYQPDDGDLLIDNQSIYEAKISSLRENISLVSQETTLFDDTIKNNIKYANENVTDEDTTWFVVFALFLCFRVC